MEIGIVGCGMVGGTLKRWLEKHTEHKIRVVDSNKGFNDDFSQVKAIFIAIPVPTHSDGTQWTVELDDLVGHFTFLFENVPIFIKSTVLPGTTDKLAAKYKHPIFHMPEFLTERTCDEDFDKYDIVCGCGVEHSTMLESSLAEIFPSKRILLMTNKEAELAKYVHNVFGAMKVNYFNIIKEICDEHEISYDYVIRGASTTPFIEPYHTKVPGPDGKCGYDGKCFPKDISAFARWLHSQGSIGGALFDLIKAENTYFRARNNT